MKTLNLKRRRDIGRQKGQFIAVLVAVVLGVALFAGMFNAFLNLGSSLEGSYGRLGMADMTVSDADEGFVDAVSEIDGVDIAIERTQADVPFAIGDINLIGRVIGMPADAQPEVNKVDIEAGSYLDPDDPDGVLIETHTAGEYGLEVGDTLTILGQEVEVLGIAVSPEYLWPARDRQTIFNPPHTFAVAFVQESVLASLPPEVTRRQTLAVYQEGVDVAEVDTRVDAAARQANAADIQTLADQPSNATIHLEIEGLRTMAVALPLLFLLAAGMAIYVVVTRLVYSQRGVIGTLRASGFSRRAMSRHFRSYGIGVGLVGAVIGAGLGGLMARGMTWIYTNEFGIPDLVAEFHLPTVIMSLLFGAVAGAIAAIPPARIVASMAPAEAMRGDTPPAGGRQSLLERVIPPLHRAPVRWKMVLRGLGRNKKRSMSMVLGVVLSMTLLLAAGGMLETMLTGFDRQFNEINIEDATVIASVPVAEEQVQAVVATFGVVTAEPVISLRATVKSGAGAYTTQLESYEQATRVHGFPGGIPAKGVLLGWAIEDLLEIEVGDVVDIEFPDLETTVAAEVAGFVDEPLTTLAYMEQGQLVRELQRSDESFDRTALQAPSVTSVKAVYDSDVSNEVVLSELRQLGDVAIVIDSNELRRILEEFQAFFYVFVGLALLFGGTMAFALMYNIISVNVAERVGEFASMRANGLTHRRIAALVRGETFLLTAIGILPGLATGSWAAVAFMKTFSSDQFPMRAEISVWTYTLGTVALFVVAALSLVPAVRAVKRINVAEVVRERAV